MRLAIKQEGYRQVSGYFVLSKNRTEATEITFMMDIVFLCFIIHGLLNSRRIKICLISEGRKNPFLVVLLTLRRTAPCWRWKHIYFSSVSKFKWTSQTLSGGFLKMDPWRLCLSTRFFYSCSRDQGIVILFWSHSGLFESYLATLGNYLEKIMQMESNFQAFRSWIKCLKTIGKTRMKACMGFNCYKGNCHVLKIAFPKSNSSNLRFTFVGNSETTIHFEMTTEEVEMSQNIINENYIIILLTKTI